ncbi:MAG: FeoA family protein [Halobacteriota archaeon]|nr:FeoA family protein [Halobacteriota archaeon]
MESSLDEMNIGQSGMITQITGGHGQRRHMRSMGLREGKNIKIITKQPVGGPIIVEMDGNQIAIGRGMAMRVLVDA